MYEYYEPVHKMSNFSDCFVLLTCQIYCKHSTVKFAIGIQSHSKGAHVNSMNGTQQYKSDV